MQPLNWPEVSRALEWKLFAEVFVSLESRPWAIRDKGGHFSFLADTDH